MWILKSPNPKEVGKRKLMKVDESDIRDKRERLVACVLSGNSKQYLGKEYTEQQINEMDCNNINTLLNKYESVLSAQMTKSLGKSIIKGMSGETSMSIISTDLGPYGTNSGITVD